MMRLTVKRPMKGLLASLLAIVLVAGCGPGDGRFPVSGQVLVDGQPLTTGTVTVAPENDRAAFGKIGPDGRFTLTTETEGDGCVAGTHRVAVTANEVINPNRIRQLVPGKYADLYDSELTVTINGPTDDLVIEVSREGQPPTTITVETAGDIDPSSL